MALILVIDDDGFYLDVLRNVLTDEGHEVMLAQGGIEGLALYQDRRRGGSRISSLPICACRESTAAMSSGSCGHSIAACASSPYPAPPPLMTCISCACRAMSG